MDGSLVKGSLVAVLFLPSFPSNMSTTGSSSASSSRSSSHEAGDSLESQIHARDNPNWKLCAPPGTRLIEHNLDAQEFDWDAVNDEDNEIWLIRAPSNVRISLIHSKLILRDMHQLKAKHLEELQLDTLPAASLKAKTMKLGRLVRGEETYDLWALGTSTSPEDGDSVLAVASGEMNGLSCLLPRKSKSGKLYAGESCLISTIPNALFSSIISASRTPTRRFVVSMQPVRPAAPDTVHGALPPESLYQNPPRLSYDLKTLKHQFIPYGHSGDDFTAPPSMDVDTNTVGQPISITWDGKKKKQKKEDDAVNDDAEKTGKKRKVGTAKEDKTTKKKAKVAA
jgi:hypothetical protein